MLTLRNPKRAAGCVGPAEKPGRTSSWRPGARSGGQAGSPAGGLGTFREATPPALPSASCFASSQQTPSLVLTGVCFCFHTSFNLLLVIVTSQVTPAFPGGKVEGVGRATMSVDEPTWRVRGLRGSSVGNAHVFL